MILQNVAWRHRSRDGFGITFSHLREPNAGKTICGKAIPEGPTYSAPAGIRCAMCVLVRDRPGRKKQLGPVTHEEIKDAVKVFLSRGGIIRKDSPEPVAERANTAIPMGPQPNGVNKAIGFMTIRDLSEV